MSEVKELPRCYPHTSMRPPVLSVVVPAFNESAGIFRTINEIREEFDRLGGDAELIVVDDGSVDETAAIVAEVARSDDRVKLVRASHAGKGATVRRGMLEARGTWRFLADADLSMPISELKRFLDAAAQGGDVIVGSREAGGARSTSKFFFSRAAPISSFARFRSHGCMDVKAKSMSCLGCAGSWIFSPCAAMIAAIDGQSFL